jgi:uncharacterized protein YndB with AHSA1/START domain
MSASASTSQPGAAPPPVIASVRIAAPPEVVFPYFTDATKAMRWIASSAELDARPGGVFAIEVEGNPARGTFVEVDPPHRVIFTWGVLHSDSLPPGSTWVEVVLEADRDETVVTLTHHGLPDSYRASHQEGWTRHLGTLGSLFGGAR